MANYISRPKHLTELIAHHFRKANADRVKAADTLAASIAKVRGSTKADLNEYLLQKVTRALIHEHARAQRESTPKKHDLYHYPIKDTDKGKYLADADAADLDVMLNWHRLHAETNKTKAAFFQHLALGVGNSTVRQTYSPKMLEDIYSHYVYGTELGSTLTEDSNEIP